MTTSPGILYTETGVSVDRCTIITGTGNQIDLSLQMLELNVFEDIFSPTISATIAFEDTLNLIEALPIIGQEWMFISVSKPGLQQPDGSDIHFSLVLRVYKVEKVKVITPFKQIYLMHLTEEDMVNSNEMRVAKTYTNSKPEAAIRDIFINSFSYDEDLFKEAFDEDMETTQKGMNFTISNLRPFEAISYISSIAQNENGIHDYFFFENNGGYRFASLSSLFKQDPVMNIKYRIKQVSSAQDGSIDPYINSTSPIQLQSDILFDYIQSIDRGEFGIQSYTFDLSKQKFIEVPLSYDNFLTNYKKDKTLNQYPKIPENDWQELPKNGDPVPFHRVMSFVPKLANGSATDDSAYMMPTRLMQISSISNQKIKLNMPGSAVFKAGSVINLLYPSISSKGANDTAEELLDNYLAAKYLITSVRHVINNKTWNSYLEVSKDTLPKKLAAQFASNFSLAGL